MVPEDTSEWKPEMAPHAIVTNRAGKTVPLVKRPFPVALMPVTAGMAVAPVPVRAAPMTEMTATMIIK